MLLERNEDTAIRALKKKIGGRFPLLDFRVFGSRARGDGSPDSDIDAMIELAELDRDIESEIYDMVYDTNLQNDCFISLVLFTRKEIEEGPMSESPIYKAIMREGVVI